jgi:hypothetical protein
VAKKCLWLLETFKTSKARETRDFWPQPRFFVAGMIMVLPRLCHEDRRIVYRRTRDRTSSTTDIVDISSIVIPLWQLSLFPDVDGALEEIAYALDTLKLDGVVMLTNFNGVYLGDKRLDPVFDELNRRGTVVFNSSYIAAMLAAERTRISASNDRVHIRQYAGCSQPDIQWHDGALSKTSHYRASRWRHLAVPGSANRHVRPRSRRRQQEYSCEH